MKTEIFKKINKFFVKNWRAFFIIFIALGFFTGASVFNYTTQTYQKSSDKMSDFVKWSSPDETANYFFAKLYAQENKLAITENYNLYINDIIRPRSFRSDYGQMKPVSFLGIILIYGKIGQILSYKVIPYLTPFFAAVGIFYFYLLAKKLFNQNVALLSAVMLAFFPPYFYYSSRSMFHNILFTVMLIIGFYYSLMMTKKSRIKTNSEKLILNYESNKKPITSEHNHKNLNSKKIFLFFSRFIHAKTNYKSLVYSALAGGFIGLAIITRTSELLWLGPVLLLLWLFNIRKVGIIKLLIFLAFLFLALLPVGYCNQILYGSFYYGGYGEMNRTITNVADAGGNIIRSIGVQDKTIYKEFFYKIKDNILFFGFHPGQSLKIFYKYFFNMFSWLFWFGVLGFFWYAVEWWNYKYKRWIFLVSYFIISIILIYYYGSWEFHDNPDPRSVTIGNSYTRYWLPIYLGAMLLASFFIVKFTKIISRLFSSPQKDANKNKFLSFKINKNFFRHSLQFLILLPIIFISFQFSLFGSDEGLIYLAQRQKDAKSEWSQLLGATESNSVIITQYHDKLLFPERKVIVGLFDDPNMIREYARITEMIPTYYYNFTFPDKTFNFLNSRRLFDAGLSLQPVKRVTKDFTLYKLNLKDNP